MILSAIVAMDRNRVIGYQNKMPWYLPADLKHFKNITMGHPIIMGRNTFESLGKPLPGRLNIVITHRAMQIFENVKVVSNIQDALKFVENSAEAFIIGGQQIFEQTLALIQRIYLTQIESEFPGDIFFPPLEQNVWRLISKEEHQADEKNNYDYSFLVLEKI